jgi:hypothetical protein
VSVKSKPFYWLECDDCGLKSTEGGDAAAWIDVESARLEAAEWDGQWWCTDEHDWCGTCRDKHVCRECDTIRDGLTSLEDDGYWPVCPDCKAADL